MQRYCRHASLSGLIQRIRTVVAAGVWCRVSDPVHGAEIVHEHWHVLPQTTQILVGHRDPLWLIKVDAGDFFGQHALRIAQQAGAIGGALGGLDLLVERVELGRLTKPQVHESGRSTSSTSKSHDNQH